MAELSRRSFLDRFLASSCGALALSILYPVARFLNPPRRAEKSVQQVEVGPANDPELREKGFKIVRFGNEPVIVIKAGEGDFRAMTATCTHLDCIVEFRPDKGVLWCNCHNGQYDLSGRNIAGPPPRPLTPLVVHTVEQGAGQPPLLLVARA